MATKHREKDIEHFELWSSSYENSWMQRAFFDQTHQAALALAASIVYQPGSVLDVGCGTGNCCVGHIDIGRRRNLLA